LESILDKGWKGKKNNWTNY